jgi:RNA polymerase sigma-70 factor (ECF subfamily)
VPEEIDNTPPSAAQPAQVVERLFRQEWGKMVATLTRIFGLEHLELAEDVVQEALIRALRTWPYYGIPDNPSAWIMRVSRNLALDHARRETLFRGKQEEIAASLERVDDDDNPVFSDEEIRDDRLRMIFACCDPRISEDAQVALALRTLCGFSTGEIAHAFLTTEAAVAKRLTRAKQQIRDAGVRFEIPSGEELKRRLMGVLRTLYLLFNEGYKASDGDQLVREELCSEAIRLTSLLTETPCVRCADTHALLSLMLLNAARLPARTDADGNILLLDEQDRLLWNQSLIGRGILHLAASSGGDEAGTYHLQAGIAACHCTASDFSSTDWPHILRLYDRLVEIDPSPIAALNRAVALAHVKGPDAAMAAVSPLLESPELRSYHLLHTVLGELELRRGNRDAAAGHFRRSMERTRLESERQLLARKLRECGVS